MIPFKADTNTEEADIGVLSTMVDESRLPLTLTSIYLNKIINRPESVKYKYYITTVVVY